jgi:hypothetical protein
MFGTISDWMHNKEAAHRDAMLSHGESLPKTRNHSERDVRSIERA